MTGEEWLGTVLVGKRNASLLCWKGEMMATSDFEEDQSQQTVSQTTSQTTSRPSPSITKRDDIAIIVPWSTKYITVTVGRAIIIMR
mmetsp:Transcript_15404/g.23272  ORF Transcript_15404/g.23272 Transcript_15404/m.23272 type:complete len:86 (-) Transcript_15404:1295-1552(-)